IVISTKGEAGFLAHFDQARGLGEKGKTPLLFTSIAVNHGLANEGAALAVGVVGTAVDGGGLFGGGPRGIEAALRAEQRSFEIEDPGTFQRIATTLRNEGFGFREGDLRSSEVGEDAASVADASPSPRLQIVRKHAATWVEPFDDAQGRLADLRT